MRRVILAAALAAAVAGPVLMVPTADAATRGTIDFVDHRVGFDGTSSVTTDLAECPTAEAVDVMTHVAFTQKHGVFFGVRAIECDADTGFVVRLTARFANSGSFGSWSIVDAYGALDGLRGSGAIVGTGFGAETEDESDDGIDDHYTGWITRS
jgi:hypothetical protein